MTSSVNGWPASPDPGAIGVVTVAIPLRGGTRRLQVARAAAAPLVAMVRWWDTTIEPVTELGGYNYREIRGYEGTGRISNHASGTAVDINASRHPLGKAGTVTPAQRAAILARAAELGLVWGGAWKGRPDEMHVEVGRGSLPSVRRLPTGDPPASSPPQLGTILLLLGLAWLARSSEV